ncbi:hypothetical protein F5B22DRAFT_599124, partial [Xylaria bambusicola]|uniref:uncharacterized protein n=1 Tax=Xylaria bambusicola TaxID=326684 RepID=UPI002007A4F9
MTSMITLFSLFFSSVFFFFFQGGLYVYCYVMMGLMRDDLVEKSIYASFTCSYTILFYFSM